MAEGNRSKDKNNAAPSTEAGIPLGGELLYKALGEVARTADGCAYAFTRLTCCDKGVTELPNKLQLYVHLRYIDVSGNSIKDITPLSKLPHLLTLNASNNKIEDIACLSSPNALPYLALLNLSNNKISKIVELPLQRLARLALDGNPIADLEGFVAPPALTHLSLRGTAIESLDSLSPSSTITSLYLSHTPMQQLRQLRHLPHIRTLDLEGVPLPFDQLECLALVPRLREVTLSPSDPSIEEDQFRVEVLGLVPRLQWMNGTAVTPEEVRAASEMRATKQRLQQELEQQQLAQKTLRWSYVASSDTADPKSFSAQAFLRRVKKLQIEVETRSRITFKGRSRPKQEACQRYSCEDPVKAKSFRLGIT
ncbi:hypothetical protein Esti_006118 [Eimeria stiedai]